MKELLNQEKLLASGVVANNRMNRERGIAGGNSYRKDLSFDALEFLRRRSLVNDSVAWLDLCCGEGRALIEAAEHFAAETAEKLSRSLRIIGVDLAGAFRKYPPALEHLRLLESSVEDYEPARKFDLITCVHGLHYLGDKLSVIRKAAGWLKDDGFFLANFELKSLKLVNNENSGGIFSDFLTGHEFKLDRRKRLIALEGKRVFEPLFEYVGADDRAGPNYTGQPAVYSYYEIRA